MHCRHKAHPVVCRRVKDILHGSGVVLLHGNDHYPSRVSQSSNARCPPFQQAIEADKNIDPITGQGSEVEIIYQKVEAKKTSRQHIERVDEG